MTRLRRALNAWGTPGFEAELKREIEALDAGQLPLQEGLSGTSCVAEVPHRAMILGVAEQGGSILARAGIFYSGILAGCSCADDPTPIEAQNEYCIVEISIDKQSGDARITLAS